MKLASTTLIDVFCLLPEQYPDHIALRDPHSQPILEVTFSQLIQQVKQFAGGLQALALEQGDRVALIADNSPRWLIADLGTLFAGTVNVPRSSTAETQELGYILRNSGCRALIVDNLKTLERLTPFVTEMVLDPIIILSNEEKEGCWNLANLLKKGSEQGYKAPPLERSQLATIIHTSGTGGQPKGVMLSHGNLMHQVENCEVVFAPKPGSKALSILPTWHSYERSVEYYLLSRGCTLIYTNARQLKRDFKHENPDYMVAVPRIWENIYEGIQKQLQEKSPQMQSLFQFLLKISEQYILAQRTASGLTLEPTTPQQRWQARIQASVLFPLHQLADRLIYRTIRQALGSNFKHAINGGGSLPAYLDTFFEIVNISILNGYGLTETSPILACRRPEHNVRGTVGPALPLTELQIVHPDTLDPLPIGQKGLIRARGPQIMMGYYNNSEATAKVLTQDGWFNTGDLGWLTHNQELVITGRAKDTIVLRNGENIEPDPLEGVCKESPYISQMMLVGQDQKALAALIYPNIEMLQSWAKSQGLPSEAESALLSRDTVRELILAEMQQRIRNTPGYRPDHKVVDFRFIPEAMSIENGLLTQTLKMRRLQVTERYQDLITEMYQQN
jgi:long-chain acyl-CoA synthetase